MNKEEEVQKLLMEGMSYDDIIDYYNSVNDADGVAAAFEMSGWPMTY
jgi:hypothetical protein